VSNDATSLKSKKKLVVNENKEEREKGVLKQTQRRSSKKNSYAKATK